MAARVNAGVPAGGQNTSHSRTEAGAGLTGNDAPAITDRVYSPNVSSSMCRRVTRSGTPTGP